jgi:hypothetical protein
LAKADKTLGYATKPFDAIIFLELPFIFSILFVKATITVLLGEPSPDFPLLQNHDSGFSGTRLIAKTRYSSSASAIADSACGVADSGLPA